MKPSDFVSTSGQKQDMSQSLLQTEMTDAVNSGIVDRADKSEKSLKSGLYTVGKRASTGGAASAALSAVTKGRNGKTGSPIGSDGTSGASSPKRKAGKASAAALAHRAVHSTLEGSELEGADDLYNSGKGTYRAGRAIGRRILGKADSIGIKSSLKGAGKATARGAVGNTLQGSELEGADSVYDGARAGYRVVRGVRKRLAGNDALSSGKSLGKLSEKKSAKKFANTVEAKRKAQAASYFKKNVYTSAENARHAASTAKKGIRVFTGGGKSLLGAASSVAAPALLIVLGFLLGIFLLASVFGGGAAGAKNSQENTPSLGSLTGIQLEVAQALYDAGLAAPQIAAVMGNISGESGWDPTAEYHGASGEYGFGLFQFTDAPAQTVYNYTAFANWCSANGKDKNSAAVQTEYFMTRLPLSWSTGLHRSGYYHSAAPQYSGMDASYEAWLSTSDVGFATYCFMACYERPAAWAAKDSFPNTRLPNAQSFYEQLTNGGGQDYNASDATQRAIVDAARRTPSPGAGYCAAWVSNVYENAGLPRPGGNACCQYLSFCTSSDRSQLKVGMVVGVQRSPTSNSNWCNGHLGYGHVAIYIGDGKVMENIGHVATTDLDDWISYNGQLSQPRWGFPPGVH